MIATAPSHLPLSTTVSRRALLRAGTAGSLGLALGASTLLSACGSGDIVSALTPSRFISFGDGLSDLGQGSTGARYTINDGTINTWADRLANRYGLTLTAQAAGGLGYAQGHGVGEALPRTVTQQIDAFLASNTLGSNDVVLINLPMADVLGPVANVKAGTQTEANALAQVEASGRTYVAQVRRLIAAGAKQVLVLGVYDLGKSPWAIAQAQEGLFTAATLRMNDGFKTEAVNLGANLLFVDAAFLVNRNVLTGSLYGFIEVKTPICTTTSSLTCTSSTLLEGKTASQYLFADQLYLTPAGNQQLGDYAYDQLRARW
jgi:phospholipase/lecithinase/hemolysin